MTTRNNLLNINYPIMSNNIFMCIMHKKVLTSRIAYDIIIDMVDISNEIFSEDF